MKTYKDVQFPFDTEMVGGTPKVRLLAAVCNDYATHIIGYTYYGDDPNTECSQVLEWDENGVFSTQPGMESMALVLPPGAVEARIASVEAEMVEIRQRLADNPDAPEAWRSRDEAQLRKLEGVTDKLRAPHIWNRAA